jgi:hypothetical protein
MNSPQVSHFVISSANTPATLQEMKDRAVAEMRKRIEEKTEAKDIRFTFRPLNEVPPGLVMNITWEVRADF